MDSRVKRIAELEDALKVSERRVRELRQERDAERALVAEARELLTDKDAVIDQWIAAFDMELNDKGEWAWEEGLQQRYDELQAKYDELLADWNRFVARYNASVAPRLRNFGRPLGASEAQRLDVLKRHADGQSGRAIADPCR